MGAHSFCEFAIFLRVLDAEVGGFEWVALQVVKFPRSVGNVFEKLPWTASHGPGRIAHVLHVAFATGEKDIALEGVLFACFEKRENGFSVNFFRSFSAGNFDGSGEEVHGEEGEVGGLAGLDDPGPDGTGGNFEAAFVHRLLAAAEVSAIGSDVELAAVVGDKNGEGVLPLAVGLKSIDDLTDAMIHVLDESDELGAFVGDAFLTGFHFLQPILGRLDGSVRSIVGEVEEEGLFLIFAGGEEVPGPVGEDVGGVAFGIHLLLIEAHVVLVEATVMVIVVHHITEKAVEVIKATRVGMGFLIEPEMPFADSRSVVPQRLENLGKHDRGRSKVSPTVFGMSADNSGNSDQFLIVPGEKCRPGW